MLFICSLAIILLLRTVSCQDKKEVVQSGQPTHFHMEDRGPEIQVTADAEGVKINAKPAGLNVVAKPGHIPATIPHSHFVSTIEDIHGTPLENGPLHHILQPIHTHPELIHHGVEPIMYTAPVNGLALRGDISYHHTGSFGTLNPSVYETPNQFYSNGNVVPPPGYAEGNSFPLQLPTDYMDYLRWRSDVDDDFADEFHHVHHHHPHYFHRPFHHHYLDYHHSHHNHHYDDDDYESYY